MQDDPASMDGRAQTHRTGIGVQPRPAHLPVLTPLRGIAALLVVMLHLTGSLLPNLDTTAYTMLIDNGYLAVDLFFLMSGVVIAHVYGPRLGYGLTLSGTAAFLRARLARLYPLHFCTLAFLFLVFLVLHILISLSLEQPFGMPWEGRHSFKGAITNLLLIHGIWNEYTTWNYPSWSISTEFFAYLTFPLFAPVVTRLRRGGAIIAIAALFAGLWWLAHRYDGLGIITGPSVVRCILQFAIGTLLYQLYLDGVGRRFLASDATFAGAAIAIILGLHLDWPDILVVPFFMVLILAAIHNAGRVSSLADARPLVWCGEISFSLYMTHGIVDDLARILFGLSTGSPDGRSLGVLASLAVFAAMLVLVFALSNFTYRRIEVPGRRWLNGRRRVSPGPAYRRPSGNSASPSANPRADWR